MLGVIQVPLDADDYDRPNFGDWNLGPKPPSYREVEKMIKE